MPRQDIDAALQRLAENRIEQAMREGKFDNLAGAGQPIDLDSMPADENARMVWWALRLMKQGDAAEPKAKAPPPLPGHAPAKEPPPLPGARRAVGRCINPLCGTVHLPGARFCRRCGAGAC